MGNPNALPIFQNKPESIFECDDPTLDPMAITHGIQPPDHRLAGGLALIAYGILGLALYLMPGIFKADNPIRATRTSFIDIQVSDAGFDIFPNAKEGPSGGGQRGDGFRPPDREPSAFTTVPQAIPALDDITQAHTEIAMPPNRGLIDLPLPFAPGGSGRSRGDGPGSGGGTGGGTGGGNGNGAGSGSTSGIKYPELAAIYAPKGHYILQPGEPLGDAWVSVAITIEADGHVSSAKAFKGPSFLYKNAEANALTWKFLPLAKCGLSAPYKITIRTFYSLKNR